MASDDRVAHNLQAVNRHSDNYRMGAMRGAAQWPERVNKMPDITPSTETRSWRHTVTGKLAASIFFLTMAWCGAAQAHGTWCNGTQVAPEVKASCCGKADAHQVPIDAAREIENGDFMVTLEDGSEVKIDHHRVSPSPDGCTWIWYSQSNYGRVIYCFMIPMGI